MMKDNCWRLSFEEFNWKYALTYKEKKENEINDSFIDLFRFRNHTKLYKMAIRLLKSYSTFFEKLLVLSLVSHFTYII